MFVVVCCRLLFGVCCLPIVVRCSLSVGALFVVRRSLYVVCCLLGVRRCSLFVVYRCLSFVVCCLLSAYLVVVVCCVFRFLDCCVLCVESCLVCLSCELSLPVFSLFVVRCLWCVVGCLSFVVRGLL